MKSSIDPKYIKMFSDSRAALQALDSYQTKTKTVQHTINELNKLGTISKRLTLNWIKAHNKHEGNEEADKMAKLAANCDTEHKPVPIANKLFKNHLKTAIYAEWIQEWKADQNKFKHTKLFFPIMDPRRSKSLLKLSRLDLKLMVEIITGHNNLKEFSTKIKELDNVNCRFCGKNLNENVEHVLLHCDNFKTERNETKLKRFLPLTNGDVLQWSIPLVLQFFSNPAIRTIFETPVNIKTTNS